MGFVEQGGIRYYQFDSLQGLGVVQGIYTRRGGVSPEPWRSLNLGGTVGDERANVVENRRRIFDAMGLPVTSIFDCWQVHGTDVICATEPRPLDSPHRKADAILTDRKEITLFMRFADCTPIFLVDPVKQIVGMVHAGWRGTVDGVTARAVRQMEAQYGSRPEDIFAGIGPSICAAHYPVGPEVAEAAAAAFGAEVGRVLARRNGSFHLDLWEANRLTLEKCGVRQIETAGICTACHTEDWYSHRAERGKTGRFGALLTFAS